jgi:hypothetical protein
VSDLKKYIFVDLDDTLTHSILTTKDYSKDKRTLVEVRKSEYSEYDEYYAVLLKKNTHLLLGYLRSKYDRVILLTMATKPYAQEFNKVFSLGFFDWDILDRGDIRGLAKFTDEVFIGVLLDNLPKSDPNTWRKLQLIAHYARDLRYRHVHMRAFEGHSEHSFSLDSGSQSIKTLDWHINYELSI